MHKPLTEMSPEEFDAYIEQKNIARQSQQSEDLRSPLFYPVIRDFFSTEAEKAEETIVLHGQVVGSQLELHLPAVESGEYVMVNNNEIILDNLRLVIDLVDDEVDDLSFRPFGA